MTRSILKQSLIFSGIVLFAGVVLVQVVAVGLSNSPTAAEEEESEFRAKEKPRSTVESANRPEDTLAAYKKIASAGNTLRVIETTAGKQVRFKGAHNDWILDTVFSRGQEKVTRKAAKKRWAKKRWQEGA